MHRIGSGSDIHRLLPKGQLILGGVQVSSDIGVKAHSDGDVLAHAVIDALCGAASLSDIGEHFPDNDSMYAGADSMKLLEVIISKVRELGYSVCNIDTTIHLEKPKLKNFKKNIALNMAGVLAVDVSQVNVKAKTAEGFGPVGTGEAISADAVVLLCKN